MRTRIMLLDKELNSEGSAEHANNLVLAQKHRTHLFLEHHLEKKMAGNVSRLASDNPKYLHSPDASVSADPNHGPPQTNPSSSDPPNPESNRSSKHAGNNNIVLLSAGDLQAIFGKLDTILLLHGELLLSLKQNTRTPLAPCGSGRGHASAFRSHESRSRNQKRRSIIETFAENDCAFLRAMEQYVTPKYFPSVMNAFVPFVDLCGPCLDGLLCIGMRNIMRASSKPC